MSSKFTSSNFNYLVLSLPTYMDMKKKLTCTFSVKTPRPHVVALIQEERHVEMLTQIKEFHKFYFNANPKHNKMKDIKCYKVNPIM